MLKKLFYGTMAFLRRLYYRVRRRKLKNSAPTILCNNCFGGLVYHNLGLQFRSPTVNLFFPNRDFFAFAQDLPAYLAAELREAQDSGREYPVGELSANGRRIEIYFMHYPDFETAAKKWNERKARMDLSNIHLIFQTAYITEETHSAFAALPYKNKLLIAGDNPYGSSDVVTHPVLAKADYRPGELLEYKSRFSLRRHMDDIDYIGFLNRKP